MSDLSQPDEDSGYGVDESRTSPQRTNWVVILAIVCSSVLAIVVVVGILATFVVLNVGDLPQDADGLFDDLGADPVTGKNCDAWLHIP